MLPDMVSEYDETEEIGGKQLAFVARGAVESFGPGPDKRVYDAVTDDGAVYRFEQQRPGEPYTFAPGDGRDDRATRSGRLPGVVEAVLDADLTDEEGDPEPGWVY